jgi:hypothetical protein
MGNRSSYFCTENSERSAGRQVTTAVHCAPMQGFKSVGYETLHSVAHNRRSVRPDTAAATAPAVTKGTNEEIIYWRVGKNLQGGGCGLFKALS